MIRIRDAFLKDDDFHFQVNHQGVVQLSFGPTHICMNLDSAYGLQYRLASFLANIELNEYPEEDDPTLSESRAALESVSSNKRLKRVD